MKFKMWIPSIDNKNDRIRHHATFLLGFFVITQAVNAQDVFVSRLEFPVSPPALQQLQASEMEVFVAAEAVSGVQQEVQPFRWGPLNLRPHPFYRFIYGEGIQAKPGQPANTVIQEIAPGFALDVGSHWILDYVPTWRLYSNNQFRNNLDHSVGLTGGTTYEDWVFGLSQNYTLSSTPLVETGTQTDQEKYFTAIKASCRLNSKMSLDLTFNQNLTFAEAFNGFREWSTLDWLNYQFWPRFDASIGAGFGYVDVDTPPNMTYEQFQCRIGWRATDKISFQLHGGLEDRQFLSGVASDTINPVAGGQIQYLPFETTKILVNIDHSVSTSLISASSSTNQITESTDIRADLNQRLLKKFYLDLGGAYHTATYVTSSKATTDRKDDYHSFMVRLSYVFLKHGTAAAFYQISDNSSSKKDFTFSSSQFGFEIGYRY